MEKLLVSVLGHRNSGKSTTWNTLFGRRVRTGSALRRLYFRDGTYIEVFLVSGSPEERGKYVGDILNHSTPAIVLCSMQYIEGVEGSFDYFASQAYDLFVQWLNPGHCDESAYDDSLNIGAYVSSKNGMLEVASGKGDPSERIGRISEYLYAWAKERKLLKEEE